MEYSRLDANARGLVQFHRNGFGVDDEGYINDFFIDEVLRKQDSITRVVMHFAQCLLRQQLLEVDFLDGANVLKKQTALPMFHIGDRKSIYICKKGMRWVLKQFQKEIAAAGEADSAEDDDEWEDMDEDDNVLEGEIPLENNAGGELLVGDTTTDDMARRIREQVMNYRGNEIMDIFTYKNWLIRLFDIGKNGNFNGFPNPSTSGKYFQHWGGVKVVTDGQSASVFYVKRDQLVTSSRSEDEDVKRDTKDDDDDDDVGKPSSRKIPKKGDKKPLVLPLPPKSELWLLFLYAYHVIYFKFNSSNSLDIRKSCPRFVLVLDSGRIQDGSRTEFPS